MKARKERVIGYLRVSTAEQMHGAGIEIQRDAVTEWARANGARLIGFERDEGLSGSNGLDTRHGLAGALSKLEADEADALVVYRLDRLARDLILQETTIERLRARDKRVVSVTEPDVDSDDHTRVLVRQVLGAISQYERAVIRARMQAGARAKRARGGYAGGRPPYGYRAESGTLAPHPAEQEAIRLASTKADAGWSLRAIAQEFDRLGIRPRSGTVWHPTQVARVIERGPGRSTRGAA